MTGDDKHEIWHSVRQGDLFAIDPVQSGVLADGGSAPVEVAVISQTCDVVNPAREFITVAVTVDVPKHNVNLALRGSIPRYVRLPALGDARFIDMSRIATIPKSNLQPESRRSGVAPDDWDAIRAMSRGIGRNFSRFAFPDDFVPWFEPLRKIVEKKANKTGSAIGRVLEDVSELRVAAADWTARPLEITFYLVIKTGKITDWPDPIPEALKAFLSTEPDLDAVADRLRPLGLGPLPGEEVQLFDEFARLLAAECEAAGRSDASETVRVAVLDIETDVRSEDEFGLNLYRQSELVDVDYLSPPSISS